LHSTYLTPIPKTLNIDAAETGFGGFLEDFEAGRVERESFIETL